MKIINKPTATFKQCEAWVKSKKTANKLALDNLPIMWNCAIKNGIDPCVLIAQSMKETGWYNFGGVVPASYHNPCGLKITKGGGDYEVGAHMRFKSWEEGIMAQSDHLALYAGASGYPRSDTYDPRHFATIKGRAETVNSLSANWAPSASYGTDIVKMIKEIYSMKVEEESGEAETIPEPKVESPIRPNFKIPPINPQVSIKPQKKPIVNGKAKMRSNVEKSVNNFKKSMKHLKDKFKR